MAFPSTRYLVLCCDYDGTLAHHGKVDERTLAACEQLRTSGRKLVLVTGRRIDDLATVFQRFDLFDLIVAENGAVLHRPESREETLLGEPPPASFVTALRSRGVAPLEVGRVIVATHEPHEGAVLETIRDQGLELQVTFNKGAVMVLPPGVNKATGLAAALAELQLSPHNAVAVGDAENDHALLHLCECAVAVANALPALKARADIVTAGDHGAGVVELIEEILADDLAAREPALVRHHILLGRDEHGNEIRLPPHGCRALVVGTSGGGKSTIAVGLMERLEAARYSFCVIDPEGDYEQVPFAVSIGDPGQAPSLEECADLLCRPGTNVILNLLAVDLKDRPRYFENLLARLGEIRVRTGHPHWLIVDEAHHVLAESAEPVAAVLDKRLASALLITVSPALLPAAVLRTLDTLIVLGDKPQEMFDEFTAANDLPRVTLAGGPAQAGTAIVWDKRGGAPRRVRPERSRVERRRHVRKYAEGELPPERSFFFRGPEGKLNLRAQNLIQFLELADGVDDETWTFHLRSGDIAAWVHEAVKDEALARQLAGIAGDESLDAATSRRKVREAVEATYTLPAGP
ncbi:MAG: phosphoglycolate phosphatase [Proteobacteria bacterium]|nr:MAG: phosphoglycolate phosphatase [Pseudomonadota bacterium]